jgi:hypothetical protein
MAWRRHSLVALVAALVGGVLERDPHRLDDLGDRLADRLGELALVDFDFLGDTVDEIAALYLDRLADAVGGDPGGLEAETACLRSR